MGSSTYLSRSVAAMLPVLWCCESDLGLGGVLSVVSQHLKNGIRPCLGYVSYQRDSTCSGLIADGLGKGRFLAEDVFFHTLLSRRCCHASGLMLRMDLADLGLGSVLSVVSQHLK